MFCMQEKSLGDLRRHAVTQNSLKNYQLKLEEFSLYFIYIFIFIYSLIKCNENFSKL